ncbi:uncharacterized protein [Phaseolus vulgaris]|uniref:uncharacterized protein n=1 Tax=Phaseolus vulgaris TaxID=3885 RepID=UPI0035CB6246
MTLYTTDNNVGCKVFPTSLQGEPLTWFTELPPNSIDDFDVLAAKFSTQYATSRPHHMSSMSLLVVQQEKGESLRTFLDRFNKAYTAKHCQYHRNFGHTTEGCQALKDKIEELIQTGHLRQFVKKIRNSRSPPRSTDRPSRGDDRSYRNDYKRRTDHSQASQKRNESPIRRTRARSTSPDRNARPRQRVREVINMIAGPVTLGEPNHEANYIARGFAGGRCSNFARKKHPRDIQSAHATTRRRPHIPSITFTDDDFTAIDPAQDDPMVITVEIDKFAIAKTLVDQGSSVDILYWEIFKKMRIPEANIQTL